MGGYAKNLTILFFERPPIPGFFLSVFAKLPCFVLDCTTGKKTKVEEITPTALAATSETSVRVTQGNSKQ